MLSQKDLYAKLRKLIGSPSVDKTNERDLLEQLRLAVNWLAAELDYHVVTADLLTIVADDYDYDLPEDCDQLLWVEYNGSTLEPGSIARWIRDRQDWRDVTAASPSQYTIQNRQLIVYPKPSSDAVTTDATLAVSYVSHSPAITESGIAFLSEATIQAALHRAGWAWLMMHPGDNEVEIAQRAAMKAGNEQMLAQVLQQAKRRMERPIKSYTPVLKMRGIRQGAAR